MAGLGHGLLALALAASVYGLFAAVAGGLRRRPALIASSRRAAYAVAGLATIAFVLLEVAFIRTDLHYAVVSTHSSHTTPLFYRATAAWSSQQGSLLLWLWLLSAWTALVLWRTQHRMRDVQPWATAVLLGFIVFFATLLVFVVSPFETLATAPPDGAGLNPLLRYPSMMTHPPMLYAGYTLFAVPFAYAVGALIVRRVDAEWLRATRGFTLGAWLCLGIGILLGARWSYAELGWGGYWGWDAVENASLLPWLTGTAFIHSAMVQERRGMLKVWNASLILATGTLAILGTFLVRSGVISSIHAFTGSDIGWPFAILILVMIVASVWLVVSRRDALRTERHLDGVLSRESMFLANNVVLVAMAFVVFWGTFFPLTSQILSGEEQTLGPPWYGRYVAPLALALVALTAIGPMIPWRRTSLRSAGRALFVPALTAAVAVPLLVVLGAARRPLALIFLTLVAAAVATVVLEFVRGIRARRVMAGEAPPRALISLLRRNRRRYGGYLVHLGIVVLLAGVAGSSAFAHQQDLRMTPGQTAAIGSGYSIRYEKPTARVDVRDSRIERINFGAEVTLFRNGRRVGSIHPERGFYPVVGAPASEPLGRYFNGERTSEVVIRQGPVRDVWLAMVPDVARVQRAVRVGDPKVAALAGSADYPSLLGTAIGVVAGSYAKNAPPATFRAIVAPLVFWIWIGGGLAGFGTLICLVPGELAPRRVRAGYAARVARELGRA